MHKFYLEAEFWVSVAFILVMIGLFKPISGIIKSMLKNRINNIIKNINDAGQLKEDAQSLLAEYQKKLNNANNEAKEILDKSLKEIEFLQKETLDKLAKESAIKEKEAELRIKSAQSNAEQEIINLAGNMAVKKAKEFIEKSLNSTSQDKLIDDSISKLTS